MSTLKTQMITTAIRIITGSAISNQLALASPVHPVPSKLACSCPLKVPRKLCNTHQFLVWSNYRSSPHWSSFIHPEGKAYFSRNSGVTVVTKANMYDGDTADKVCASRIFWRRLSFDSILFQINIFFIWLFTTMQNIDAMVRKEPKTNCHINDRQSSFQDNDLTPDLTTWRLT